MSWVDDEGNVSDEIVPLAIIDGGVIHWLDEEEHALHDAGKLPYRFEKMTPEEVAEMEADDAP
jgi:hypothetical protein